MRVMLFTSGCLYSELNVLVVCVWSAVLSSFAAFFEIINAVASSEIWNAVRAAFARV